MGGKGYKKARNTTGCVKGRVVSKRLEIGWFDRGQGGMGGKRQEIGRQDSSGKKDG